MKTAQEYADELRDDPGLASDLVALFERIQSDARHAALTECHGIIASETNRRKAVINIQQLIRDNHP